MSLRNRIFLTWSETAQVLEMDEEGFRQAMLYRFSPLPWEDGSDWLPAILVTKRDGFMADLYSSHESAPSWGGRDAFYRVFPNGMLLDEEGKRRTVQVSDEEFIPVRGAIGGDSWEVSHGYDSFANRPFVVSGDSLYVSPESIRSACREDGYYNSLLIAPAGWCADGFPDSHHFRVVHTENNVYDRKPENLFKAVMFRQDDVLRVARLVQGEITSGVTPSQDATATPAPTLTSRREKSLLRIIRALDVMAKLPERGAAPVVELQLQELGFGGPSDETIRKVLAEARALEPDS